MEFFCYTTVLNWNFRHHPSSLCCDCQFSVSTIEFYQNLIIPLDKALSFTIKNCPTYNMTMAADCHIEGIGVIYNFYVMVFYLTPIQLYFPFTVWVFQPIQKLIYFSPNCLWSYRYLYSSLGH